MTDKLTVKYHGEKVGTLSLTPDNRLCAFEYDREWLAEGFSVSPLELPLKPGLFIAKPRPFYGNFGIFEDSLPDGYGRYLLHRTLMREGIDDRKLTSIDRLSLVGNSGMGALCYEPETIITKGEEMSDFDLLQEKALEVLKEQQDTDAGLLLYNSGNSGGCRPKAVFSDNEGHWLIKFRHTYDPMDMGLQEFHYNEVAKKCGINVTDFKLTAGKYFTTRRFDITEDGERIHTATAGGLLCVSLSEPVLDYSNLMALTGYLTQNPKDVEEMYRRMVFNYLTDNKDDHCKNFSFLVKKDDAGKWKWHLAPAYDLTLCAEGYNGQHATSVNQTGFPTLTDFIAVGAKTKMSEKRCREIFDEVYGNCGELLLNDIR
ncbi:type II toxin-antitoxin system HipA family toxin [uncultured Bacteroides sp.]|uniref:type II toxin-antitoxin system HipA family toxin n=1 Tax=uncultured Bacteroides sp. TaxID=162156 RepID=UPI00261888E8|nr:type II toxin-antitoxin system HipA family toxin [uncultured Bacteroides sp.]